MRQVLGQARIGQICRLVRCREWHVQAAIDRLGLDQGRGRGWRTVDWGVHGPQLVDELRRRGYVDVEGRG